MRLANLQYLASGACVGLDVERIRYVKEEDARLYGLSCGNAGDLQYATDFLARKRAEGGNGNPYVGSVVVFFRWGSSDANADGQGCSGTDLSYIVMPSHCIYERTIDGHKVFGNNHLSHELGHFLSLNHTFRGRVLEINELADKGNPDLLPLTEANASTLGIADLAERRDRARELLACYPHSLDADAPAITNTLADLGPSLPLVLGRQACDSEAQTYQLKRYDSSELTEVKDPGTGQVTWTAKAGAKGRTEDYRIDDSVRRNIMSYWACDPPNQRLTDQQAKVMEDYLLSFRSEVIGRILARSWWWDALRWVEHHLPVWLREPLYYRMPSRIVRAALPGPLQRNESRVRRALMRSERFARERLTSYTALDEWRVRGRGGR
jgi:hypothetical protein